MLGGPRLGSRVSGCGSVAAARTRRVGSPASRCAAPSMGSVAPSCEWLATRHSPTVDVRTAAGGLAGRTVAGGHLRLAERTANSDRAPYRRCGCRNSPCPTVPLVVHWMPGKHNFLLDEQIRSRQHTTRLNVVFNTAGGSSTPAPLLQEDPLCTVRPKNVCSTPHARAVGRSGNCSGDRGSRCDGRGGHMRRRHL